MAQEKTLDEEQGTAEQLDLPITPTLVDYQVFGLRDELDLVPPALCAATLGVAEQTLAVWRAERTGPDYVKLGKAVFYRREDLKRWVASHRVPVNVPVNTIGTAIAA